jgi:hypothetical protein
MNWTRQRASDQRLSALATSSVVLLLPAIDTEVVAWPRLDLTVGESASSQSRCGLRSRDRREGSWPGGTSTGRVSAAEAWSSPWERRVPITSSTLLPSAWCLVESEVQSIFVSNLGSRLVPISKGSETRGWINLFDSWLWKDIPDLG